MALFEQLRKEGITACGTILKDRRGLPEKLKQTKLKKGKASSLPKAIDIPSNQDSTPQPDGRLHAVKYNDKKEVVLLSTCCTGQMINTGKRDRDDNAIVKPEVVHLYNQNMNGVDQFDQHLQYYNFIRKTWEWWKRLAFHLIHLAKVQSYIIYKKRNPRTKKTQFQFTTELTEQMTAEAEPPSVFRRRVADPPERLKETHFCYPLPATDKKKYPQRICVFYSIRNDSRKGYSFRRDTRYECPMCNKGMCCPVCFQRYHTLKNYEFLRQVLENN